MQNFLTFLCFGEKRFPWFNPDRGSEDVLTVWDFSAGHTIALETELTKWISLPNAVLAKEEFLHYRGSKIFATIKFSALDNTFLAFWLAH